MVSSILLVISTALSAGGAESNRVVVVQGAATVTHANGDTRALGAGDTVREGDVVEAGAGSYVRLMMSDGSVLDLGANARLLVRTYQGQRPNRKVSLKLWFGRLWARVIDAVDGEDSFTVSGANAVVGIRGTEFVLDARADGTAEVTVLHGRVSLTSLVGDASAVLGAMERGTVGADGRITQARLSPVEAGELREQGQPAPELDDGGAEDRLNGVRERLQLEITPTPEPIELAPAPADDALDGLDRLDRLDDDPTDPLLDLDPDVVGGALEQTTRVRGDVEVLP